MRNPLAVLVALALVVVAPAAVAQGPAVTVLLHHPHPDDADPFGFPFAGSDSFTARHAHFEAESGRFDYPYFVADGILPIAALPDPAAPYVSVREAYGDAVAARAAQDPPVTLLLSSSLAGDAIAVRLTIEPEADLAGEDLHAWAAIMEDPVHYQAPAGLTNGVTDHRFTLRAIADLGPIDLGNGTAVEVAWHVRLGPWEKDRILVAAWVEQSAPSPRFDAREVVQATHARLGASVTQAPKGVLVEVLSATWCDPCLYGDRAAEDLAVSLGAARPLAAARVRYFEAPANPWLTGIVCVAAGAAIAAWARRSPP